MAETLTATGRVKPRSNGSAIEGKVVWAPAIHLVLVNADRGLDRRSPEAVDAPDHHDLHRIGRCLDPGRRRLPCLSGY
jgi:hypothetical protein